MTLSWPLPVHEFVADLDAAMAHAEIAKMAADAQEHVNRSFGQLQRRSRERFARAVRETGGCTS
mgnify:CR=1 FL=1